MKIDAFAVVTNQHNIVLPSSSCQPKNPMYIQQNHKCHFRPLYSTSTSSSSTTSTAAVENEISKDVERVGGGGEGLSQEQKEFISSLQEEIYGRMFIMRVQELLLYKNIKGSCSVPKRYKDNPSLGNWVNKTRQMYRKYLNGESSSMTEERIKVLDDVGFIWSGANHNYTYNHIQTDNDDDDDDYYEDDDDDDVSTTSIQMRNAIKDKLWMDQYERLKQYWLSNCKSFSNLKSSQHSNLSSWVGRQRREYNNLKNGEKSSMTKDRIRLLQAIDFDWSPRDTTWNTRIQELLEYKARYGDCLVPVQYEDNPRLGRWVSTQRKFYKMYKNGNTSRITKEKIKQLSDVGFVWSRWEHNWSDNGCLHL